MKLFGLWRQLTQDSEFDGLEENDHFDEEDYFTSENESFRSDDFEANKARAEDCKEENVKKRERELIENNLRDFPFFRGVMAAIDVHRRLQSPSMQQGPAQLHRAASLLQVRQVFGARRRCDMPERAQ